MTTHYNYALNPERTRLPACQLGALGKARDFSGYAVTTDKARVTCRTCRKVLGMSVGTRQPANLRACANLNVEAR